VIVGMVGRPVRVVEDLLGALRDTWPGRQVEVTTARGTKDIRPTVTIGTITA
jgi:hypothetical protein